MKLKRGTYPGASEFAYFDVPVGQMRKSYMRALLECILHRAATGERNAEVIFRELEIAEVNSAQQVVLPKSR